MGGDQDAREVVLDTETTGLSPTSGHRILEVGAVEIVNLCPTGRFFHRLVNPERDVPEEAVQVHGHSIDKLCDMPIFSLIADELLQFIGGSRLVIHNAEFDVRFLNAEFERMGHAPVVMDRVVDTLVLARTRHPGQMNSLDALCMRYRIDRSRRVKHGALLDAEILAEVYAELMGGRQGSLALEVDLRFLPVQPLPFAVGPREGRRLRIQAHEIEAHLESRSLLGAAPIWADFFPLSAAAAQ